MYGAVITIGGAVITIVLNIVLIPKLHYTGAALATFCCYLFMMLSSYLLGQKYYPVPYPVKKLIAYLTLSVLIYLATSRVGKICCRFTTLFIKHRTGIIRFVYLVCYQD